MKKSLLSRLKKHKNLYKYFRHFYTKEEPEHGDYLANITIWFREVLDKAGISDDQVPSYFGWDYDLSEEFGSWGHNSRWKHCFQWVYLFAEKQSAMELGAQLADEFGDPDIDELYFKNGEPL